MFKKYHILYEDADIIAVDKPAGMLVIPTPKKETNTLTDALNRELDSRGIEPNAYPCHRLDRETSGIIVYSKGKKAQALIMDLFRRREVKKRYIAFVHGRPGKNFDTISEPIYNRNRDRMEDAVTRYKVLERHNNFSVLEIEPVTGRTNQIRIHMKILGHPIVGESVFAYRKDYKLKFKRAALHARSLGFVHPVTGRKVEIESRLPDDMAEFINNEG